MNLYTIVSAVYDILVRIWLSDGSADPRIAVEKLIPDKKSRVLDMCCGTMSNGLLIAEKNHMNTVVGLDRSKSMLREAQRKIRQRHLDNVKLICRDASDTGLRNDHFDHIIIGLVLHECSEQLRSDILNEAKRLLRPDGTLIVIEWEREENIFRKLKFAPVYILEILNNPRFFKDFYDCDKTKFFEKHGFIVRENIRCNYTSVISMSKKK